MKYILSIILFFAASTSFGQETTTTHDPAKLTVKQGKYELSFVSKDTGFDTLERQRLIKTFFEVYPKLAKKYNKHTLKQVNFIIDPAYDGVAATDNGHVRFNPKWFKQHPQDIDVVTHEVMHIVQDYKESVGPGWLTEGIADYARYQFGVNNPAANWKLPDFKAAQSYTNAYRITARFLAWLELHKKKGIVKKLNKQLRDHTYTDNSWKDITGSSLDELWAEYAGNPAL